jgi:glycosyltransferase involved in cell wall biosynthesis
MRTMTAPVTLSFLVPTYNPGPYLVAAIESIADQLIDGDEVIIQDGGSTDDSLSQLESRYGHEPWLSVKSEPDSGQSDALQRALDRCTNDYLMWLNADDIIYPGALAAVRAGLEERPDLLTGRSTIFKNSGRIVRTYTPGAFSRRAFVGKGSNMFTGSFVYSTELVRGVGGFDADYQYCMDMDLFARMSEREPSVVYIPEIVGGLRWHDDSKGATNLWPIITEATQVRLEHARTPWERVVAVSASGAYWVGGMVQPIRHSKPYSWLRAKLRRQSRQRRAVAP